MKRFPPDRLKRLVTDIFAAAGCGASEAERVAHYLVESNLVGHDSHGVIRVPIYVKWLQEGKVVANRSLEIVFQNDALAVVDGGFGFGQVLGEAAVKLGVEKAKKFGLSAIALRNCGHLGRIGDWPTLAAEAGLVSLHFVNTSGLGILMAPHGGINRRLSANPVAAGVPRRGTWPLILDMSTSSIAEGKIKVAFNKGVPLAEGLLIDAAGKPLTDPKIFYGDPPGAILPFGGHKGYGLALITEVLAGALTGGGCSTPGVTRLSNGMLSIYLDPEEFAGDDFFQADVRRFVEWVKSSQPATPGGEILVPGEVEERTRAARSRDGIELDDKTWQQIVDTAQGLGVAVEAAH